MFDTLTPFSTPGEFETMLCARPDPGGFLPEARTGAREAAAHMKIWRNHRRAAEPGPIPATRPADRSPDRRTSRSF